MNDLENRLAGMFAQVAETTEVPAMPTFEDAGRLPADRRFRRRRVSAGVLVIGAVLAGSLGAAAAIGVNPPGDVVHYLFGDHEKGAINPKPGTARVLLTTPGPDGKPMQLWYTDATRGGYCVQLAEWDSAAPAPSTARRLPTDPPPGLTPIGGACGDSSDEFAGENSLTEVSGGATVFSARVPGASTVRLVLADNSSRALPIEDHWTAGWLPYRETEGAAVVGYDTAGGEVGRWMLPLIPTHK
jgi:hypothetical protein